MKPNEYYTRMVSSITRADVRLVAACMTEHVGQENAVMFGVEQPVNRLAYWNR